MQSRSWCQCWQLPVMACSSVVVQVVVAAVDTALCFGPRAAAMTAKRLAMASGWPAKWLFSAAVSRCKWSETASAASVYVSPLPCMRRQISMCASVKVWGWLLRGRRTGVVIGLDGMGSHSRIGNTNESPISGIGTKNPPFGGEILFGSFEQMDVRFWDW